MKIYNIILRGIEQIEFPRHVTKTAITIIRKFCRENPTERLGYQKDGINDVKKHRYEIHNLVNDRTSILLVRPNQCRTMT